MSLKDKLDEEPEQVEGWRPENEGDELIGKVLRYNMRKTDDYEPYPVVTVEQEGGDRKAFHAFHTVAKTAIEDLGGVGPGDEIAIRYLGKAEGKTYPYHDYRIVIEHSGNHHAANPEAEADRAAAAAREEATKQAVDDIPF